MSVSSLPQAGVSGATGRPGSASACSHVAGLLLTPRPHTGSPVCPFHSLLRIPYEQVTCRERIMHGGPDAASTRGVGGR